MPAGSLIPASPSSTVPERPPTSLAPEHREHHGGVRRRERGAQHAGDRPVESQDRPGDDSQGGGGRERPEQTDRADVAERSPEPVCADVAPAVEQDDDERDHRDALDGEDLDPQIQRREDVGRDGSADEEQRRGGDGHATGDRRDEDGERESGGNKGHRAGEVGDFGQHDECCRPDFPARRRSPYR